MKITLGKNAVAAILVVIAAAAGGYTYWQYAEEQQQIAALHAAGQNRANALAAKHSAEEARRIQAGEQAPNDVMQTQATVAQPVQPGLPKAPSANMPGPAKPDSPQAIVEFNAVYEVIQTSVTGNMPEAQRQVIEFGRKYPDTAAAYALLGELKYIQFQMAGGCGGMSDEVVMLAQKAIAMNPQSAEGYTLAAKTAVCNQNVAWYSYADKALELSPNKPEAMFVKARILEAQRDFKGSEAYFRRTIDAMSDPVRQSNIYAWLAGMLTSDERLREDLDADLGKAQDAYRKAMDLDTAHGGKRCRYEHFMVKFMPNLSDLERMRKQDEQTGKACRGYENQLFEYAMWAKKYLAGKETVKSLPKVAEQAALAPDDAFVLAARLPGRGDVVRALLKGKAISNIDTVGSGNDRGQSGCCPAIVNAAYQRDRELAALLLKNGANVNATGDRQRTPLAYALYAEDVKLTEMLLANGARPNATFEDGVPALYRALLSKAHAAKLVQALLENGANPNATKDGKSMAHVAVTNHQPEALTFLIAHGADPNVMVRTGPTQFGEWTAFREAMSTGDVESVGILLAAGVKDDVVGRDGLEWARSSSSTTKIPEKAERYRQIAGLIEAARARKKTEAAK